MLHNAVLYLLRPDSLAPPPPPSPPPRVWPDPPKILLPPPVVDAVLLADAAPVVPPRLMTLLLPNPESTIYQKHNILTGMGMEVGLGVGDNTSYGSLYKVLSHHSITCMMSILYVKR